MRKCIVYTLYLISAYYRIDDHIRRLCTCTRFNDTLKIAVTTLAIFRRKLILKDVFEAYIIHRKTKSFMDTDSFDDTVRRKYYKLSMPDVEFFSKFTVAVSSNHRYYSLIVVIDSANICVVMNVTITFFLANLHIHISCLEINTSILS